MPWTIATNNSEILAIHVALLPTNQILMFGGSEHNPTQNEAGAGGVDNSRLYNLSAGAVPLIETIGSPTTDVFCAGHAFLADGRLLVAGGTEDWGGGHAGHPHNLNFLGERGSWIYAPRARAWRRIADLNPEPGQPDGGGRWYPTVITLANGEVLAIAGHPRQSDGRHNNDSPERYAPAADSWTVLAAERLDPGERSRYYPRCHLLPDGNIFFVSPVSGACRVWDPFAGATVGSTVPGPGGALYDNSWDFGSILLPLLPGNGYQARVLVCGDVDARRVDLSQASPAWQTTAARTGAAAGRRRRFGCPVLLPTGQVFVSGGIDSGVSDANAVREGELYDPGIDWSTGQYSQPDGWSSVEQATVVRNYHSTALLLPNGRVWTAGSSKNADAGDPAAVGELRVELYQPPYDAQPNRPELTSAPVSVGYGQTFEISSPQAGQIDRVVLTRCGSATHAFDADQRLVALVSQHIEGDQIRVSSPPNSQIAPPGYYLLWLLDQAGLPCREARFIRVCPQRLLLITDRSTFSRHEVEALGTPATFTNALYVVLEGFLPSEVGTPPAAPVLSFTRQDGSGVPGLTAELNWIDYEDDTIPPDVARRITFAFNIRFTSVQAFDAIPPADQAQTIQLRAVHGGNAAQSTLVLSKNPNPYMRDGAVHWLSTDVRVFTMRPGLVRAGIGHGGGANAPIDFIQALLARFNQLPTDEDHPFFDISDDIEDSRVELADQVGGQAVFNYAVAKVRFRAPVGIDATDVRVFFRMFTTAATGLEYTAAAYPRQGDGSLAAPLLGLTGNEILAVPFFAESRQTDMRNQGDTTNRRSLAGAGAAEVTAYFGCWLDFNQTTPRFPLTPPHNGSAGPFGGALLSIQELMRNHHCCLAAEIHYPPDPIPTGATPGSHDNLSQRNLIVVDSDNPGNAASHMVSSTFELRPSLVPPAVPRAFGILHGNPQPMVAMAADQPIRRVETDELMIRWNDLPADSRVRLFVPNVGMRLAVASGAARLGPPMLSALDDDTVLCRVGGVNWVPIPGPRALNIPGLLSIELPPTVKHGQRFNVSVHQVSGFPRRIIGAFQIAVVVSDVATILPLESRKLAVLRHIGQAIPANNRWHPVWLRLLGELGDHVRGLGGDPDSIQPSPHGDGGFEPSPDKHDGQVVTGKVRCVLYDCFGEFEGFVLTSCEHEVRVKTCARGIERVAVRACRDGLSVAVTFDRERRERIERIAILCC